MNDEIKEILDNVKKCCDIMEDNNFVVYQKQDILKLFDYMTNLQQEKDMYKDQLRITHKDLRDYISRCEKVIEYFKYQLENLDFYEDTKARMLCAMGIVLLQNGSDDNG